MYIFSSNLLWSVILFTFVILHLNGCAGTVSHRDITKTKDGGYIIVKDFDVIEGGKSVFKLRSDKIQEWQWQIEEDANYQSAHISTKQDQILNLIEASDGSYVGVGRRKGEFKNTPALGAGGFITTYTSYNPLIFKLDSLGKKSWEVVLEKNGWLYNVVKISNGDFIACGASIIGYKRKVIPQEKGLLIRFSKSGKIIWSKELLNRGRCGLIIQTKNKEILLVGSGDNRNLYVAKFDLNGMPVWQKIFDVVTDGTEIVEQYGGLFESNDGSYVFAGPILSGKHDGYMSVACLKSDGELNWKTLIKLEEAGMRHSPSIYDMKQLTTSDYIILGAMSWSNLGFLSKISSNGKELRTVGTYYDGKRVALRRIHANPDGTYTLYGLSSEEGSGEKIWTIELNANGETLNGN